MLRACVHVRKNKQIGVCQALMRIWMDAHTLTETDPHGGGVGGDKGEGDVEEYVEEDGDGVAEHEDGEEGEVNPALKKQLEQLGVHLSFQSLGRDQVCLPVKSLRI